MKMFKNIINNKYILILIGGIMISIASVSAAIIVSSNEVSISSTSTTKTNLHDAIEELYGLVVGNSCPYGQTCIRCGAGSYADQTNMVCSSCIAGTYSTGGVNSCLTCPNGYTSDASASSQNECYIQTTAGKFIEIANTSVQLDCPAGSYCPSAKINYGSVGQTNECPGDYTSDSGSDEISDCYVQTTAGKYIATANDLTQTDCPEGSYCPSAKVYYGSTGNIQSCGENMISNAGSTSESDCHAMYVTCPDGYTSDGNVTDISECYIQTTAGKYIATANSSTQTNCPSGSYCPSTKVYYGNTGSIETCPNGYTKSAAGANSISKCYVTTTGGKYIKTAYATTQTQCPANSYCPSSNIYYGSTGKITACGSGKTSPAGSDEASDCKSATTTVTRTGDGGYVGTYTCSGGTGTLTSCVLKTDMDGTFCRGQNGTAGTCAQITSLASEPKYTCYCPDTYACKQLGHLTDTISC